MISENLTRAKATLSSLVNAALQGEDVIICKDGLPAVRLVPVRPVLGEDPCRRIPALEIAVGAEAVEPLGEAAWGEWVTDGSA
ncbi:MAG: type II toxin-antitoxin system prevent-host-death family antitoxin [Candidatus Eremiobacterota bacterium]